VSYTLQEFHEGREDLRFIVEDEDAGGTGG